MSRPNRVENFGTYFTTTQTWERQTLFQVEANWELFIETIFRYRKQDKFLLHEFVVMPDHVHLIMTPTGVTIERAMQLVKGGFSFALGKTGRSGEVWQKGFTDHRIRDWNDFLLHKNYLRRNPVKRGLCGVPEEYHSSSANSLFELDDLPQRLKPLP
jgi:putative transposase